MLDSGYHPEFSIILPTYNRANKIKRAIDSVLVQTIPDWELIVVDNFSSDGTSDVVMSYSDARIKFIRFSNNGVIAASRNKGIEQALGKFVAFLDSDDWWHEQKLASLSNEDKNKFDVFYTNSYHIALSNKVPRASYVTSRRININNSYSDLLLKGNTLATSSVIVRASALRSIKCFSTEADIVGWEDYYAWLELARMGYKFCRISKALTYYDFTHDNFSKASAQANLKSICNKFFLNHKFQVFSLLGAVPAWVNYQKGLLSSGQNKVFLSMIEFSKSALKSFIYLQPILFAKSIFRFLSQFKGIIK